MEEFPMKKLAFLSILAVLAFSVALLTHVQASNGKEHPLAAPWQDQPEASTCSDQTLQGVYGISISGTRPAPPPPSGIPNYAPGTIPRGIGADTRTSDGPAKCTKISKARASPGGIAPNAAGQGRRSDNPV